MSKNVATEVAACFFFPSIIDFATTNFFQSHLQTYEPEKNLPQEYKKFFQPISGTDNFRALKKEKKKKTSTPNHLSVKQQEERV